MNKGEAYQTSSGKWFGTRKSAVVDEVHTMLNPLGHSRQASVDSQTAEYIVQNRKELIAILQQMDEKDEKP